MTPLLSRAIDAVRVWLGWNDPAANRLHASHGWLLPTPGLRDLAAPKVLTPAPVTAPGRRR